MAIKLPQAKIERLYELLVTKTPSGNPLSYMEIAARVGCSEVTVRHYAAGRRKRTTGPSEELRAMVRQMWTDMVPLEKIGDRAKMSIWKIKDICYDLPPRPTKERLTDAKKAMLREMYIGSVKVAAIAAHIGCTQQTVRIYTKHLPRRIRSKTLEVNMQRCVIVSTLDESVPYLVQPTGRMEFCSTAASPERQWQIELVDTRDGRLKMVALADILTWEQVIPGGPSILGIKLKQAS